MVSTKVGAGQNPGVRAGLGEHLRNIRSLIDTHFIAL